MTAQTRKWVHAGLVALASSTADLGAQLASGSVSLTRAALVGLGLGIFSRVLGAILAALAMPDKSSGGAALIFFALLLSPGAAQAQAASVASVVAPYAKPHIVAQLEPDSSVRKVWDRVLSCAGERRDTSKTFEQIKFFQRDTVYQDGRVMKGEWVARTRSS
jgi:hypothetical protein